MGKNGKRLLKKTNVFVAKKPKIIIRASVVSPGAFRKRGRPRK